MKAHLGPGVQLPKELFPLCSAASHGERGLTKNFGSSSLLVVISSGHLPWKGEKKGDKEFGHHGDFHVGSSDPGF